MTCQTSRNSLSSKHERAKNAANTSAPGMGWFFKGLPPAKGLSPLYPMETPNGAANTVGGRFRHQPEQMVHPPFAWQLASFPSLPVCGEEAPYCPLRDFAILRHTPRKSRHSKPFSTCHQYIRNWSGLSAAECPITGDVFCVASSPGIASDRPWPTRSRATTIRSRHTRTVSAGSSSARP